MILDTISALERHTIHAVHYDISYILQGAEHGTDGAIILLHDIPAGAFSWESIMPQLADLGRAVYAIDMLGYGESEHPWPADTSIWGHGDVLAFMLKELKLTNIILVGHGLGGGVAQVLATRLYREQVAGLVLIDTTCYSYAFPPHWPLTDMAKRQDLDAPKHLEVADMIENLCTTLPNATQDSKRFESILHAYVDPWNNELGKEMLLQHIRLMIPNYSNSVSSDLKMLKKPALIMWGAKDEQIPVTYAERLHREMEGSQLVIVPDAGHLLLFDAPDAVAHALVDFVKGL